MGSIKERQMELAAADERAEREMLPRAEGTGGGTGRAGASGRGEVIAKVDSDATGGGYYNCHLQTFDADDWNTDTDPFSDTGASIVVLNLAEEGSSVHNLDAGALIRCSTFTDDEGNVRYVGVEVMGKHTFGEW